MIGFIIAGLVIGVIARLLKSGKQDLGLIATLLLGLVGSVIGGLIATLVGTGNIFELNILGFIVAVIAAIALISTAEALTGRRKVGRRH
ncbi:membrane protein [Arthrobacter sp. H5]|uniref:GlsB/YeaQ/YmgE family stress response membrane protein n=1 Tax=Arthrobacter sp. H5 TaxID=1267973 RepID=UPI0004876B66|nr:membrane protein [Arthrobacter sp. H5]